MIGIAITEIMEGFKEMKQERRKKKLEQMSQMLADHRKHARTHTPDRLVHAHGVQGLVDLVKDVHARSKLHAWTRMIRVVIPSILLCLIGTAILVATEGASSRITCVCMYHTVDFGTNALSWLQIRNHP
jgi:hypothetical protein